MHMPLGTDKASIPLHTRTFQSKYRKSIVPKVTWLNIVPVKHGIGVWSQYIHISFLFCTNLTRNSFDVDKYLLVRKK